MQTALDDLFTGYEKIFGQHTVYKYKPVRTDDYKARISTESDNYTDDAYVDITWLHETQGDRLIWRG